MCHYASVNDHFFSDCFSFDFRNLHFRNRAGLFLLFSNPESLRDPDKPTDDQDERDCADDDSCLFHLGSNILFTGR